jgi:crotonobetainyl-CoA:carnitine CoA-transferase CaiB-like acyl-CoA transferase
MIGVPEWIPRQLEVNETGPAFDQFYQNIKPWVMEYGTEEIVELCQTFRIPAVPVGTGANLQEMRQLKSRSFFIKDPAGEFIQPGFPYRLEATPASLRHPSPRLGEHNTELGGSPWSGLKESIGLELKRTKPGDEMPFSGLKVIDFGTFWAGPFVSCYLGAMGADVIKIESAQRPDSFRYSMAYPQLGDDWYEQGGVWQGTNLNKRDLTLDLNDEDARKVFEKLVARSDVMIENFSPRVINNLGFGVDRLKELNPALIIVRMPGFGLEGPWQNYVGWAMSFEQACGAAWVTGDPDGLPLNPGGFADPVIGMHAAVAVQAALNYRNRTGVAQVIEVAQLETASCWTAEQVIAYSMTGKLQSRTGNRSETIAPQGVYQCSDGQWIALSIRDDEEWVRLIDAMGSPDGAGDSRFASLKGRLDNHDEIEKLISSWCGGLNSERSVTTLRSSGIPVTTVMAAPSLYDDPHLSARKFYQVLDHSTMGQRRYPRWPMIQNPGPKGLHRYGAPTLGQHNAEVLRELGLTESEIENFAGK